MPFMLPAGPNDIYLQYCTCKKHRRKKTNKEELAPHFNESWVDEKGTPLPVPED
jgi:hypothetical protein